MSKTVQRDFTVNDVVLITRFYNSEIEKEERGEKSIISRLSNLTRWNLTRNLYEFKATVDDFEAYSNRLEDEVRTEWFNEEKSELATETVKDKDGNDVLDDEGKPVTREVRKLKEEYIEDYNKYMDEQDKKTLEVLTDSSKYNIKTSNVGDELEEFINELTDEEFENVSVLLFMDSTLQ